MILFIQEMINLFKILRFQERKLGKNEDWKKKLTKYHTSEYYTIILVN